MISKKGDERLLSFYWIVIFVIVTIAVVSAVVIFSSAPLDIRGIEASLLSDSLINCVSENGRIKEVFYSWDNTKSLEQVCNLYLKDMAYLDESATNQYFVAVRFEGREIKAGNDLLEPMCNAAESEKNIPKCNEKKLFLLDKEGKLILIKITSAIRKIEKNAVE